jgi:RNA recognition motif-containing protein
MSSETIDDGDVGQLSGGTTKRKRDSLPEELEIDISLPEPPSKKQARKDKKKKKEDDAPHIGAKSATDEPSSTATTEEAQVQQLTRSEFGIWIGNLPWSATKAGLRSFIMSNAEIGDTQLTRIHMPSPKQTQSRSKVKAENAGFAYVDVDTQETLDKLLALSETDFNGRNVLIKNAKSFEGRPQKAQYGPKSTAHADGLASKRPPSKRIFVGNLGFDISREDIIEHYSQCGEVADAFLATFEDSGKCKGYGWITFEDVESAQAAVQGFVLKAVDPDEDEEAETSEKSGKDEKGLKPKPNKKPRKWYVNRIHGRTVRVEFAEDPTTRYNKRFRKHGDGSDVSNKQRSESTQERNQQNKNSEFKKYRPGKANGTGTAIVDGGGYGQDERIGPKVDARTIKPGAALAKVQRQSAAIVKGTGKKITFD